MIAWLSWLIPIAVVATLVILAVRIGMFAGEKKPSPPPPGPKPRSFDGPDAQDGGGR